MTTATLLDGSEVEIRAIRPSDEASLISFHDALSAESRRLRFFSVHPRLTAEEAAHFAIVDHVDREALVAINAGTIVGVGRYDRIERDRAEVAFAVADDWHERGIATLLLDRLAERATTAGVHSFVADALVENRPMLDVFRHWAVTYESSFVDGAVHVEMTFGNRHATVGLFSASRNPCRPRPNGPLATSRSPLEL